MMNVHVASHPLASRRQFRRPHVNSVSNCESSARTIRWHPPLVQPAAFGVASITLFHRPKCNFSSSIPQVVLAKSGADRRNPQCSRPIIVTFAGFNIPNLHRGSTPNPESNNAALHNLIAAPPAAQSQQPHQRPDAVVFAGFNLPNPLHKNRPNSHPKNTASVRQPNSQTHLQPKQAAQQVKQQHDPKVQATPATAAIDSINSGSLAESVVAGSLHLVLVVVWLGALITTTNVAARFATVSRIAQPTARIATARTTSVLATALAAFLGGLLRLAVRVLAVNLDVLRVMSIGAACFFLNQVSNF